MISKKFKEKLRKYFSGLLVGTTLLTGIANTNADDSDFNKTTIESKIEKDINFNPKIDLSFKNPAEDAEANTKLKNTAVSVFGEGIGFLGEKLEGQEPDITDYTIRISELGINGLIGSMLNTLSHEAGHYRVGEDYNANSGKIHFGFLGRSFYTNRGQDGGLESDIGVTIAGPNQNSLNTLEMFRTSQLYGSRIYEDLNKVIERISQNMYAFSDVKSKGHDYKNTEEELNRKGFNVSKEQIALNNSILNLLSADNYLSLFNIGNFLVNGKRENDALMFSITEDIKIGLPNFTHYLTTQGEFAKVSEFVKFKNIPIELNLIHDLDFTQKNTELNRIGAGVKVYDIKIPGTDDRFKVSPYASINLQRSNFNFEGINAGIEGRFKVIDDLCLTGKIEYNQDDLDARVKGKDDFYFSVGLRKGF